MQRQVLVKLRKIQSASLIGTVYAFLMGVVPDPPATRELPK